MIRSCRTIHEWWQRSTVPGPTITGQRKAFTKLMGHCEGVCRFGLMVVYRSKVCETHALYDSSSRDFGAGYIRSVLQWATCSVSRFVMSPIFLSIVATYTALH